MTPRPTPAGFLRFVRARMGVPETAIADDDPTLTCCFCSAMELIPRHVGLERLPVVWANTVYNLAASLLLNYANDTPPSTYFADQRKKFGIGNYIAGITSSASDQGTSGSVTISNALSSLTLADLMMMQDPFGRAALAVLMELGPLWGYTP